MAMAETIEQLKNQLAEKDNIVTDLTNSYNNLNMEFSNAKITLQDKDNEIHQLNEHITYLEQQLEQQKQTIDGFSGEYQKIMQTLNLYRATLIQLCKDFQ